MPTCLSSSLYRCSNACDACESAWNARNAWDVWLPLGTNVLNVMHDIQVARLSHHVWNIQKTKLQWWEYKLIGNAYPMVYSWCWFLIHKVIVLSFTNITCIWICFLCHEAIASRQHKFTSGHTYTLASGAISWFSRLHRIVASSTTETEYISATKTSKKDIWLARFCNEFGIPDKAPVLGCNSQRAICLGKNAMFFHASTKHIDVMS